MKRGTPQHPKTTELSLALGIERWGAVGILETLWHWVAQYAPAGDVGRFQNATIAEHLGWRGDADRLIEALVQTGWIDVNAEHRLVIHDWSDHVEDSVHLTLARRGQRFADGSLPKTTRLSGTEKKEVEARLLKPDRTKRTACAQEAHGKRTKSALPEPEPEPEPEPSLSQSQSSASRARATPGGEPDAPAPATAPAPAPPADAAPVLPTADELADLIERHPKARKTARSTYRRKVLAQRIRDDGRDWVAEAVRWICTADSPEARRLASQLARFEDALEVHGEVDRLEAAHRLMDEFDEPADPDPTPTTAASSARGKTRSTANGTTSANGNGASRNGHSHGPQPPQPGNGKRRIVAPKTGNKYHPDYLAVATRAAWEVVDPDNAFVPVPKSWQETITDHRIDIDRAFTALLELAHNPHHRSLVIEFATNPATFTPERFLAFIKQHVDRPVPPADADNQNRKAEQ